ncbi:MAG: hypothetical protein NT136_01290 [Candidatus Moranbacteria bacterium]|nr:hypothetical protein [Candidatus Moranbacteria bacterium]
MKDKGNIINVYSSDQGKNRPRLFDMLKENSGSGEKITSEEKKLPEKSVGATSGSEFKPLEKPSGIDSEKGIESEQLKAVPEKPFDEKQKERLLSKENKIFLDDFKEKIEKGILKKLNKSDEKENEKLEAKKISKALETLSVLNKGRTLAIERGDNWSDINIRKTQPDEVEELSPEGLKLVLSKEEEYNAGLRKLSEKKEKEKELTKRDKGKKEGKKITFKTKKETKQVKEEKTELLKSSIVVALEKTSGMPQESIKKEKEADKETPETSTAKEDISAEDAKKRNEEYIRKHREEMKDYHPRMKAEEVERKRAEKAQKEIEATESDKEKAKREYKETQERQEKLRQSKEELDQARPDYAEMDYKKRKLWMNVRNYFGNIIGKGWKSRFRNDIETEKAKDSSGEEREVIKDEDVAYMEAIYYNKLFNYKNAVLEDIRERGLSGEEIKKELAKEILFLDHDEPLNLCNARTQARTEYLKQDKSLFHLAEMTITRFLNFYNKLPRKTKWAITAGVWASGSAALIGGKRILAGLIMGAGTAQFLDVVERQLDFRKSRRETEKMLAGFEGRDDQLKDLDKILKEKIFQSDAKFQRRKWLSFYNRAVGTLVATAICSGAMAEITHWLSEKLGLAVPEKLPSEEKVTAPEGAIAPEETPAEVVSPVELAVEKGSSLEGSIINYLEQNPDLMEKYQGLHGGREFNSGQIAHRMALEWAKDNPNFPEGPPSLIHPDTKITIDPENLKIINVEDPQDLGYLPEKEELAGSVREKIAEEIKKPEFARAVELEHAGLRESPGDFAAEIDELNQSQIEEAENRFSELDQDVKEAQEDILRRYDTNYDGRLDDWEKQDGGAEADLERIESMEQQKEMEAGKIEQLANSIGDFKSNVTALRKGLSLGDINNWSAMKNMTFENAQDTMDISFRKKLSLLVKYCRDELKLGNTARPRSEETLEEWTRRIARIAPPIKDKAF